MTTVLVSDPDHQSRRLTTAALRFAGYAVETATTVKQARSLLRRRRLSAVIFDPTTHPTSDAGLDALAAIRAQTDIPILVVSASVGEPQKVAMLDGGADDVLAKPYGVEELLARLRAVLRRTAPPTPVDEPLATPDFTVDVDNRRWIRSDGGETHLTPTEWRLVEMLLGRPGRLVTQTDLLLGVWGPEAIAKTEYLRVHLTGIRHKVEPDPTRPRYFITVPGLGLRFDPAPTQRAECAG
ncbi:MAG TPA: winged helix-turn-helix domain-containing protein [Acidimicrobiales bacterium]|nr:winged helix-turn-helix domain-containing protein [Acidimicrobiales bacterium]